MNEANKSRRVQIVYTMILNAFSFHQNKRETGLIPSGKSAHTHFDIKSHQYSFKNSTRMFDITGVTFIKVVSR